MMATIVNSIQLERIIREKETVIVLFSGDWCPDCQRLRPVWNLWEKDKAQDIYRIEIPREGPEWKAWGLQEIPTVAAFNQGSEVHRVHGTITREDLDDLAKRCESRGWTQRS